MNSTVRSSLDNSIVRYSTPSSFASTVTSPFSSASHSSTSSSTITSITRKAMLTLAWLPIRKSGLLDTPATYERTHQTTSAASSNVAGKQCSGTRH
ncbi:Os03g0309701 [Oryza sativa Japonica Group]|uniref:Os03g0309701 protein n=1 Tax=Oryza sativa subsp. japonica TaxID=39947 RepID=A0A0P0VXE2_ORYSJ|nr:Os03g0309701 [Oryza sativa Japonica Group]